MVRGNRRERAAWRAVAAGASVAAVLGMAACSSSPQAPKAQPATLQVARTRDPSPAVSVIGGSTSGALAAQFAAALFAQAPVVVVSAESRTALGQAETVAGRLHAPMLLGSAVTATLAARIRKLSPRAVLAEGLAVGALKADLPGVRVVGQAEQLPAVGTPAPVSRVAVLVNEADAGPAGAAITATAGAAGATVIAVHGWDPRADPAAIEALARLKPLTVIAAGANFGPAARLKNRIAVAETGTQLPGGGQVLFPGRRLIALYGHPGTPSLGVLGEQDLPASIARAEAVAAEYKPLSGVPVVPAFEIIATVAQGSPGPDGSYSYATPVSQIAPWVQAANAAGMYVVLDLQPGRASLLAQAKLYTSLLKLPDVGLALDAEWKLQPGQVPLKQIGHVDISEVNSVAGWLAALTARYHLPQKLLVLHQFLLSMIVGEQDLDTGYDDLSIVIHMDGQGSPGSKQATWDAVTGVAPRGVFFGWKNFLVKDHPMLTPQETMTKVPTPVMISYQ